VAPGAEPGTPAGKEDGLGRSPAARPAKAINRIIFTGDFLRPADIGVVSNHGQPDFRPSQTENITWFHRMFRRKLADATGLPVEVKMWGSGIDTPALYGLLDIRNDVTGWVEAFSASDFPEELIYLFEDIFEGSLVIAFELADCVKRILTFLGIPFVDLNIHPVRFLPDVFFAVHTNNRSVFEAMKAYHTASLVFYDWADLLSANATKLPRPGLPPDARLLVGQTNVDRSLIVDGRLRNFASYSPELRMLVGGKSPVYFKPHPYNPTAFGLLECGLPFGTLRWTSANVYALMAAEELDHVIGISSSVLAEARFFGKKSTALAKLPVDFPDEARLAEPGQHFSIYDACFDADFWRDILSSVVPTTRRTGVTFRRPPNTLRVSLRNFWGYNEVSTDFLVQVYRGPMAG
jgi:hypothetical protein